MVVRASMACLRQPASAGDGHGPRVTAETYRQLARQARASSAAALSLESRQQWSDVAAHYEMLADFVDKPKPGG
jgi:hypothetical protein